MHSSLHAATHALWLTPSPQQSKPLNEVIERMAAQFSGPIFLPHLTLLAGFSFPEPELHRRASRVAQQLRRFPVTTEGIGLAAPPFRALFLPVLHQLDLLRAHSLALEAFEIAKPLGFLPHLSLFYGFLSSDQLPRIQQHTSSLASWAFDAVALQVVAAFGAPREWRILHSFPLSAE